MPTLSRGWRWGRFPKDSRQKTTDAGTTILTGHLVILTLEAKTTRLQTREVHAFSAHDNPTLMLSGDAIWPQVTGPRQAKVSTYLDFAVICRAVESACSMI